ncbi:hypothetical protein [Veronia pacifica]|uniref:ABM domain-containing protein n=1 Tax=Veronia pacifica TaxID=1080227 RepID=A0A1C3EA47_9GAMM|nr:hypothetical protein [Veronia pacifica]ODA30127.1 hypothetical protein A8L45_21030 [Veronia pacifica]
MSAKYSNVVRFMVKPGMNDAFEKAVHSGGGLHNGELHQVFIKTGDRSYCGWSFWESEEAMVAARPELIEYLDTCREYLEEISPELGVTDPVSGPVIHDISRD